MDPHFWADRSLDDRLYELISYSSDCTGPRLILLRERGSLIKDVETVCLIVGNACLLSPLGMIALVRDWLMDLSLLREALIINYSLRISSD